MFRKTRFVVSIIIGLLFSVNALAAAQDRLGEMHEHQYKNAFFGFTMQFPKTWYALDNNHLRKLFYARCKIKTAPEKIKP